VGARMVIGVVSADGMPEEKVPRRVRVTTRNTPDVAAGDYVGLKARLLPPSRAALPGGYDFARDAFFAGVGAVGSTLGPIQHLPAPSEATWSQRFYAAIDQARNRLALRVNAIIGGDEGAIAAAMVTGKRDFLSSDAKDLIREAGIFHIKTRHDLYSLYYHEADPFAGLERASLSHGPEESRAQESACTPIGAPPIAERDPTP
jgi:competence protein ComEC